MDSTLNQSRNNASSFADRLDGTPSLDSRSRLRRCLRPGNRHRRCAKCTDDIAVIYRDDLSDRSRCPDSVVTPCQPTRLACVELLISLNAFAPRSSASGSKFEVTLLVDFLSSLAHVVTVGTATATAAAPRVTRAPYADTALRSIVWWRGELWRRLGIARSTESRRRTCAGFPRLAHKSRFFSAAFEFKKRECFSFCARRLGSPAGRVTRTHRAALP
jgi:hypothetical protein